MTNGDSKTLFPEEQRKMEHRQLMPFPPLPEEKERTFHTIKPNQDNGHWTLKTAVHPSNMISHAMGFVKTVELVALGAQHEAAQCQRTLAGTASTTFDSGALQQHVNRLCPRLVNSDTPDLTREPDYTSFSLVKAGRFHSCFIMSHGPQPTHNNNRF